MSERTMASLYGGRTTAEDLRTVLLSTRPPPPQARLFSRDNDCDEVYPRLIVGDMGTAQDKKYLKRIGVTHVLNAAEGDGYGYVYGYGHGQGATSLGRSFYSDVNIRYKGLRLEDLPDTNIARYFAEAADFIDDGIKYGGKVLVNCVMGISRSCTCAVAYLMIKKRMSAAAALRLVRSHRDVYPNDGFLQQLADLDNKLRKYPTSSSSRYFM